MPKSPAPRLPAPSVGRVLTPQAQTLRVAGRTLLAGERLDMAALAQDVGVNRTTLYRWFGSRDQLVADALWSLADRTFDHLERDLPDDGQAVAPRLVAEYALVVIEHPGIRAFLGHDSAYAFTLLTGRRFGYHSRLVARILGLLRKDHAAGLLTVGGDVALEDLAYTSARIIEVYAHAFELTGEAADGDRARRVLRALLR
ncbi:QsdR family transcriptional regulator [Rhodococcus sp. X156]|uniref:QsdR family transcriptional regulator n=1 Tax=Rhodococcus sp. X156 TaxID=2499145 RepID=UPI000FD82277|nr:QsdR family transcriptional regulator [Rhodococcus sp. X156]